MRRKSAIVIDMDWLSRSSSCLYRLLVPFAKRGRYWEGILLTPRFIIMAPAWQLAATYLMCLTGGSCIGVMVLLAAQLRLILRGQTYIESLHVQNSPGQRTSDEMCNHSVQMGSDGCIYKSAIEP